MRIAQTNVWATALSISASAGSGGHGCDLEILGAAVAPADGALLLRDRHDVDRVGVGPVDAQRLTEAELGVPAARLGALATDLLGAGPVAGASRAADQEEGLLSEGAVVDALHRRVGLQDVLRTGAFRVAHNSVPLGIAIEGTVGVLYTF